VLTIAADIESASANRVRVAGFAALGLCIVAFWMVEHPYWGLVNDATLYVVAALARLHPESLGHDIFLSQGSQDQYTIFSPIAAAAIQVAGVARAAAALTFLAQVSFFGFAWILARRLMPASMALLSAGLLVTLPAVYGGYSIFWYSESMLTAREPAEALVLASLAAALSRRYPLSGVCLLGALMLHPLMAAAGLVMLVLLAMGRQRQYLTLGIAVLGLGVFAVLAYTVPFGPVAPFDSAWFELLHSRMQYAFPSLWSRSDWEHACVPLATLIVGAITASQPSIRSVCRAAVLTGVCGLVASLLASDLLHIVLATQAQTWRWLWLANSLAVILIPVVAGDCWRAGKLGQATVLLLGAAWICIDQSFVSALALLAVITAAALRRVTNPGQQRLIVSGAALVLLVCGLVFAGSLITALRKSQAPLATDAWPLNGIIPACLLTLVWWWIRRARNGAVAVAVSVAGVGLCALFAPAAWGAWTHLAPTEQLRAEFDPWRRQIPPTAQVLAPGVPLIPWFLLERPSYWSLRQMAGSVFSRPTAMELLRRESSIRGQAATDQSGSELKALCRSHPDLGFLVTPADMGPTPFAAVSVDKGRPDMSLRLYRCSDQRL
jgi:hypothetical protein